VNVLIEGFGADAVALARRLAVERNDVRLAGPEPEPPEGKDLREVGIAVDPSTNLDADPGPADIAYLDPWTPETAPRVARLRAQGTRVSCLGDLLLERWRGPSIGITGTAGKTSTTALVAEILRTAGIDVAVSRGARAGNLWPTGDLLDRLGDTHTDGPSRPSAAPTLLLELTSSHLAFMQTSPTIAAITSFWPDHLELHGSLARYRAAKETIVRHQRKGDRVVVNADDDSAAFADLTPAESFELSLRRPVENGAYLDSTQRVVAVRNRAEKAVGRPNDDVAHPTNLVAAAAIAVAANVNTQAIEHGLSTPRSPPWRAAPAGTLAGIPVVDDGMAATPTKTAALLRSYQTRSIVLIAGGLNHAGGGLVHAAPEEAALFDEACDEIGRAAALVIVFGESAPRLVAKLGRRGVETIEVPDLERAVAEAVIRGPTAAKQGAAAVVFSPLFPVSLDDRARFQRLIEGRD
jgi:UDP-N-acetylmuramoylalanine--D-glutamate ligase